MGPVASPTGPIPIPKIFSAILWFSTRYSIAENPETIFSAMLLFPTRNSIAEKTP